MSAFNDDMNALAEALNQFARTSQTMEESYRRLQARVAELDRELEAKNRELALAGDYLDSILNSMSDGVIAIDNEGVITTFNRAAQAVLGYESSQIVGMPFRELFGREFSVPPGRHVMELRAKGGRMIPVTEGDASLSDRAQQRIGAVKVFQDLSEIESLREQVRRKDRLAAIGEMATTIAHEIRNPLGGLHGFAALLARDIDAEDPRARLVEKILLGAKELERIVSELLEYARPVELRLRPTRCVDLVESALGYIEADRSAVRLINAVPPHLQILADADKMRQALLNILLNAVQSLAAARRAKALGEVRVSAEEEGRLICLAITDTGCGMSEDQIQQAFMPFFTTKEKGTGLGLAVAAKIVEGHGGRIDVESKLGRGSTFWLRLPAAHASANDVRGRE